MSENIINQAKMILIPLYIEEIFNIYGDYFYESKEKIIEYFLKEDDM